MQRGDRERLSRLRKSLGDFLREIQGLFGVLTDHHAMVKGSVYELQRRCGKPTCACASGKLHASLVLSWSENGRTRLKSVPSERVGQLKELTGYYQRFRKARARLVQIQKKMLDVIHRLEDARRQEP